MVIHKFEQGTEEWFAVRKGKMTASHATEIGNQGKGLETYIYKLMAEQYSSAEQERYTNAEMERGNELEPIARSMYELERGVEIEQVGFVEMDAYSGCSPDGFVGEEGLVEIKCPNDYTYFRYLATEKIDTGYIWQMQMQMLVTGRKWCDFVAYNPNFKRNIIIKRVEADEAKQEKIKEGLKMGEEMIKKLKKLM